MVTVAPTAPLAGVKLAMVGVANTVKLVALATIIPFKSNSMRPVDAPTGTVVVMLVGVEAVTTAVTPLNVIRLFAGIVLKFVPVIVITAPTAPLEGENPVMVGEGRTVKAEELDTVTPLVATEMVPEDAPAGTEVVMLVEVADVTVLTVPLNDTILFDGVVLKLVPLIVTIAPTEPLTGLNPLIVGEGSTIKFVELTTVTPLVVTEIGPVAAPDGTVMVILVPVEELTVVVTPLNFTIGVLSKFVPDIITVAPGAPEAGLKPDTVGEANTSKFVLLIVTPLVVTEMGPSAAPAGTVVVIVVGETSVAPAIIPLKKVTVAGEVKFVPVMVTVVPTAPLAGLNPAMVGVGKTVNEGPVTVIPFNESETVPVVAPDGTVVVIVPAVEAVTTAIFPLK